MRIEIATSDDQIVSCFAVMSLLRPHLGEDDFVATVRRLQADTGFRLAYLEDDGIKSVAGYRVSRRLHA